MKVCRKCGKHANSDNDMFCSECGGDLIEKSAFDAAAVDNASNNSTVNAAAVQNSYNSQSNTNNADEIYFDQEDIAKNKVFAIFAYIGILFLIPLLAAKDSPFARFHANQGMVLFIINIAIGIATGIIEILGILSIVTLVFMVMGIINAANGKGKRLPLIGKIELLK